MVMVRVSTVPFVWDELPMIRTTCTVSSGESSSGKEAWKGIGVFHGFKGAAPLRKDLLKSCE